MTNRPKSALFVAPDIAPLTRGDEVARAVHAFARGVASLANVLGSNTFDLLVAIPVGVLVLGRASFDFAMAVPMFAVLTLATVLLFTALRTDLHLSTPEAVALLTAYIVFVGWVALETFTSVVEYLPDARV
jgi:cation:H+ antiporter